jgi:DNA-binding GntR family transcriptional regulator
MKAGDINIEVSERQIEQLESLLDDIICVLEQKKEIDDVLKAFIKLAYSISGNGYYLMEKGSLKI